MVEHVLTLKDADPPQTFTLRLDGKQWQVLNEHQELIINLSTEQAFYRIDLWAYFEERVGFELEDGTVRIFKKDPAAWRELKDLVSKQLRSDENFRHHVASVIGQAWWISLLLIVVGLASLAGLIFYLMNADEPKDGVLRFVHRYGVKLAFLVVFGMVLGGLTLFYNAFRASRHLKRATREEEWYRP